MKNFANPKGCGFNCVTVDFVQVCRNEHSPVLMPSPMGLLRQTHRQQGTEVRDALDKPGLRC